MRAALAVLSLIAAACRSGGAPPARVAPMAEIEAAVAEPSTIDVLLEASLDDVERELERHVPATQNRLDSFEMHPSNRFGMRYSVARKPIELTMKGDIVESRARIEYGLEACARTLSRVVTGKPVMRPCVSCGLAEPKRQIELTLQSRLEWDERWRLRSSTVPLPPKFLNRCTMTMFNLDLTEWKIAPWVEERLAETAKTIDAATPKLGDFASDASRVWSELQRPIEVAPGTWLIIQPAAAGVGPMAGRGSKISTTVSIQAFPRIILGSRPDVVMKPLPALRTAIGGGDSVRVAFDVDLPYEDANRLLSEELESTRPAESRSKLVIESVRLLPASEGKVMIEAMVDDRRSRLRKFKGLVRLTGVPVYDPSQRQLRLSALTFALEPSERKRVVRAGERLFHEAIRKTIETAARWNIGDRLELFRRALENGLNRDLEGARLSARIQSVTPMTILARPERIVIRAVATGTARVTLVGK